MSIPDFTTVCGVDSKHLEQLLTVWPTWKRHKPGLLEQPMLIFFNHSQLTSHQVHSAIDHPDLLAVGWPPVDAVYEGNPDDKWTHPRRYMMLAGFVYVTAYLVTTPYWLKLDTDVVATGNDDWIDPSWFVDDPAIISHPWSFTKPPDQILQLDKWVDGGGEKLAELKNYPALNLVPKPGSDRVGHRRIISWCAFFNTGFTKMCATMAATTCGSYKLPVPSQDGFMFYVAKRMEKNIIRTSMKKRGWQQWLTMGNIQRSAKEALEV